MQQLWKLKMDLPFDLAIPLLGIYPKGPKTLIWKNISTPMFTIAFFTATKIWKQPQVSISRSVDKTTMGHLYNGILLSHKKKEEHFNLCNSIDWPGEHYAKWNKSVRERQIPYDLTHMSWTNKENRGGGIEQKEKRTHGLWQQCGDCWVGRVYKGTKG